MDRAKRRFFEKRWKDRAKKRLVRNGYWYEWYEPSPEEIGINAHTRQRCSRYYCCGNKREWDGSLLQEKKQLDQMKAQLEEYDI